MKMKGLTMSTLQRIFNQSVFTPQKYNDIDRALTDKLGPRSVRLCETPVFFNAAFHDQMIAMGTEILKEAMKPETLAKVDRFIAPDWRMPGDIGLPVMACVDFAIAEDGAGNLTPKLIELQGVSSVYAFQADMSDAYSASYGLDDYVSFLPGGQTKAAYERHLEETVLGGHHPRNVILLEIDPWQQKTSIDFEAFRQRLGIAIVGVDEVIKKGDKIYYLDNGVETEIKRIYNRVIPEELSRYQGRGKMAFSFTDKLDVEWVPHPAWSFLISKCSMPYLTHSAVPEARFLNDGKPLPQDLENYVLKPLLAFAGAGVKVDVTLPDIEAIPADRRGDYMLQKKVEYSPFLEAPDGTRSKAEIRIMYLMEGNEFKPSILFARISRSKMMNVGFNKTDKWVGVAPVFRV